MKNVLVTGAKGFIGKNLCLALKRNPDLEVLEYDIDSDASDLERFIEKSSIIFHLAGINRPEHVSEFEKGNYLFTKTILDCLKKLDHKPVVVVSSSTQAALDNPYGISKRMAEDEIGSFGQDTGTPVFIFRLANVFGKWCRPFYNSVIATFCHQVAHGEEIRIDDPGKEIDFIYIDDIVARFIEFTQKETPFLNPREIHGINPVYRKSLGTIAELLKSFSQIRAGEPLPNFSDGFQKKLYSTFLSYLDRDNVGYLAQKKSDQRGYLFELLKAETVGQIFVSRTLPGITRGNHYHDTKVEKFCVLDGRAQISFRHMVTGECFSITVTGDECKIVDIPPGYTHNIKNIGTSDLITLFWANEIFDQTNPDTYFAEV